MASETKTHNIIDERRVLYIEVGAVVRENI
jgi:hypothetical protein